MAKLSVPYPLCPLIDQRSLLGVSQDSSNECVIVTLGKNIVIRYKLLDQKQVSSWSSKDKLSCPVIFNEKNQQYVAVYNHNQVRMWIEGQQLFDQVKKLKFERHIHCILPLPCQELPVVVFRDGTVSPLDEALRNRKKFSSLSHQDIQDCQLVIHNDEKYVTFLTTSSTKTWFNIVYVNKSDNTSRMELKRPDAKLLGHTVIQEENICCLYTLWSDGKLFMAHLLSDTPSHLPGTMVQTMVDISTDHPVAMAPLSGHHFAIYGAHVSEEGAVLLIYNTQYQLVQVKQKSKLFGLTPQLWCVGGNLFFASGNYLAVVPFHLDVARLAALVGSHESVESDFKKVVWGDTTMAHLYEEVPESIEAQLLELSERGLPQCTIFLELLPDILEKQDLAAVLWCLQTFDDIPEVAIVALLKFCLSESDAEENQSLGDTKRQFLDCILNVPFGDAHILPHLRSLSFTKTLILVRHLADKVSESSDVKSLEWLGLLLDSHYQQYLLSKDPKVLDILTSLRSLVNSQLEDLEALKGLTPLVQRLSLGKPILKPTQMGDNNYSIELLYLY